MRRAFAVVVLALGALLVAAPGAGAHALVRSSVPANGAVLQSAPTEVRITFTEKPDLSLTVVHVLDQSGQNLESGPPVASPENDHEIRVPVGNLLQGVYTVTWRTVSAADGHVTAGSFSFGVRESTRGVAPPAGVTIGPPNQPPSVADAVGRWAFYWGLALMLAAGLVGVLAFRSKLPRSWLVFVAWAVAAAGFTIMIAAERSRIGVSFDQLFRSGTGHELIRQGVGLGVAAVAVIMLVAWPGRGTLLLLAGTAAVTMYLHAQAGHAGASQNFTWFNVGVQWVHLLAVGVWVGGLVWLLLGTWGADPAERPTAVKRFSTIAGIALFAVAVTGVLRMVDELGGWTEWGRLLSTAFGVTILVKVGLFAGMVVLGARNRYVNVPGIAEGARRLGSLRRSVTSEIVIAAGILGATGVLTQLPPASAVSPPPAPVSVQQVVATGHDFATSVRVRLTATPGTVGLNTFEANVVDYDTRRPVNASRVQLTFSLPGKPELGSPTLELRRKGSTWTGAGTVLSMFGRWDVTLLVQQAAESTTVPLHLEPRLPHLPTQILPGNPVVYSVSLPDGNSLQAYIDPGDAGPNAVHFTFFKPSGKELPIASARATELSESGETRSLKLIRFDKGHFVANVDLRAGRWTFLIDVSIGEGSSISANFSETIGSQGGTT